MTDETSTPTAADLAAKAQKPRKPTTAPAGAAVPEIAPPDLPPNVVPGATTELPNGLVIESF
ncbi:hypothetical protein [Roseixanthobacter pseudopolyaromaticivorans]|uniref:hypothetical protein n=1 Tax=Xanthobacteraceae TaxID=335928 RepID=UPI00372B9006